MTRKKASAAQLPIEPRGDKDPRWTKATLLLMNDNEYPYVLRFELSGTRVSEISFPLNDTQADALVANLRSMQADHALLVAERGAASE